MSAVFRAEVSVGRAYGQYVNVNMQRGTLVHVDGCQWVELPGGYMVRRSEDWSETEADAHVRAALQIEGIVQQLQERADALRARAAEIHGVTA